MLKTKCEVCISISLKYGGIYTFSKALNPILIEGTFRPRNFLGSQLSL